MSSTVSKPASGPDEGATELEARMAILEDLAGALVEQRSLTEIARELLSHR